MNRRILLTLLLLTTLLGAVSLTSQAQEATSRLRVIQIAAGVPAVDVYIDGLLAAQELEFAGTTPHFHVEAGEHQVALRPAGSLPTDAPVAQTSVIVEADLAYSVLIQGTLEALEFFLHEDVLDANQMGNARMAVINAVPGAEGIDIVRTDAAPLMLGIFYGASSGTIDPPAGFYDLVAIPAGGTVDGAVATIGEVDFISNTLYTIIIVPSDAGTEAVILQDALNPAERTALTRFFHAAPDSAAVDVYLDQVLVLTNLAAGEATPHIGITTGNHQLALREAGTLPNSEAFFMETLTLGENAQTVAFMPTEEGIAVEIVEDAAADITPTNARVQVINLTDADAEITLNDAAVTDSTETAPGDAVFAGTLKLEAPLYGGTLYTVFVYGEGETAFMETPLAVNLLSVPFEQVAPVVAATAEPIAPAATEEVAVVETPVQTIEAVPTTTPAGELVPLEQTPSGEGVAAATTPSSEVVPATEVSSEVVPGGATPVPPVVNQSTPVPPVQPATTLPGVAAEVVRGQVNLNDGVNIHCREYPSTDARSLGLIPNGTEIIVRGLAGPRDDVVGRSDAMRIEDLPDISAVVAADFTADNFDAAFLEALTLGDLWLDLDWPLENGSTFGCWGNALYILANYGGDLLNAPRAYLDLLDQEVIDITPYNVPGGPREVGPGGASALPPTPTAREDHILATVSVDSSSNLQLRRTPSVNGESLALVAGGSQLIVFEKTLVTPEGGVNVPTVPEWLFVEFTATDGVVWRGWVSAQYVTLSFRGRLYNLADVPTAETIQPGGPVGTGTDTTGAAPVAPQQPAASVPTGPVVEGHLLTDPSINLNLRDLPVTTGVVRDTVPHDTILEVIGRNGDGTWYEVIYHRTSSDVRGWVAAEFIDLFFQGQPYDPTRLPVTTGEPDTIGSAIPTATTTP